MLKYIPKDVVGPDGSVTTTEIKESNLTPTRTPSTDKTIVFYHNLEEITDTIYEKSQNKVKLLVGTDGESLIEHFAMDEHTPTVDMKEKMFYHVYSDIIEQLFRFSSSTNSIINTLKYEDETTNVVTTTTEKDYDSTKDKDIVIETTEYTDTGKVITKEVVIIDTDKKKTTTVKTVTTVSTQKKSLIAIDNISVCETELLSSIDNSIRDMFIHGVLKEWFTMTNNATLKELSTKEYNDSKVVFLKDIKPLFRKYKFEKIIKL